MVPSATDAWTATLKRLRTEIPSRTVENWLIPIDPVSLDDSGDAVHLVLEVPTAFNAQYLQSRFNSNLQRAVSQAVGRKTEIEFRVSDNAAPDADSGSSGTSRDSGDLARAAAHTGSVSSEQDTEDRPKKDSDGKSMSGGSATGRGENRTAASVSGVSTESASGDSSVDPRSRPSRSRGSSEEASGFSSRVTPDRANAVERAVGQDLINRRLAPLHTARSTDQNAAVRIATGSVVPTTRLFPPLNRT